MNCDIGPNVSFVTGTHLIGKFNRRAGLGFSSRIKIGDGCWIGASVVILGGVKIGNGSVVAAGAVVINNIPKNTLVGGVPAKLIKKLK